MERTVATTLDRKMARRGVVTHDPPVLDLVAERLRGFLAARVEGDFRLERLRRLPGGASKEQFVFDLDWTRDGAPRHDRMVLRMDPPASMVETARSREFEALRAAHGTLPVPEVFWTTENPDDLGSPALICELVTGVASPAEGSKTASGLGTTYGPRLRPVLAEQFVRHIAALHRLEWEECALPSFDQPAAGTTEALDWRLAAIDRAWAEDSFEPHPTVTLTRDWLWRHRPAVDHVSLLHGDYRNGNFLFDEADGRITAILDWELTYLGDRHHDLAYAMMEGWGYRDGSTGEFYCSALVTRADLIAEYERLSGLSVDPARLDYYMVLNMYWAVVALIATGPRNAAERMTHLDVMQNFLAGLGFYNNDLLNQVVGPEER
ncbi:phosphotransferase family protein [Actinomycetospora sp.]|uniref:phosphotransferase family protein n=1 Tax=Actinomycetospora sp. TaxID=1872135 RepID=UPI002F3F8574